MEASNMGRGLRSAGLFILLVVLGDSAMTSVRGPDARKATFEFATVLERPDEETTGGIARVQVYVLNP